MPSYPPTSYDCSLRGAFATHFKHRARSFGAASLRRTRSARPRSLTHAVPHSRTGGSPKLLEQLPELANLIFVGGGQRRVLVTQIEFLEGQFRGHNGFAIE